jgi:phosphoribosylformylglycinamidine synthase
MSESQERMMAIVEPDNVEAFMAICGKWDVLATVIGEVTAGKRLVIDWHGGTVVDVPPRTVAHGGPVYERPFERPDWQDHVLANGVDHLPRPTTGDELADTLLRMVAAPNLCDKSWVTDQYDRYVRGNSVLAQPDDAGMLRIDADSGLGVALATDCNSRYALLDPYAGAQLALAEAYRNVATAGAVPLAITDCLNFGSPEDPAIMWQFSEAVRGLVDGCRVLGTPVTGGNVSFYNQTGSTPILPTPVVGVLGLMDDVTRRTPSGFREAGQAIYLLGDVRDELGGSAWADVIHDHLGGSPPAVDLAQEKALAEVLIRGSRRALLASAHDLAEGGLALAVVESALRHGLGVRIELPSEADPFVWLFSETAGRALVSVKDGGDDDLASLCHANGVPLTKLGEVTPDENAAIEVVDQFTMPLARIREAWHGSIPVVMAAH